MQLDASVIVILGMMCSLKREEFAAGHCYPHDWFACWWWCFFVLQTVLMPRDTQSARQAEHASRPRIS